VVHARSLAENAREPEIVAALQRYGTISSIIVMPKKRQALVEFDDISSAVNCVNDSARSQIFICGQQAFLNYSSHQKIVKQQGCVFKKNFILIQ
jgi:heterogeneous nuclear ribonucleoprotein L